MKKLNRILFNLFFLTIGTNCFSAYHQDEILNDDIETLERKNSHIRMLYPPK